MTCNLSAIGSSSDLNSKNQEALGELFELYLLYDLVDTYATGFLRHGLVSAEQVRAHSARLFDMLKCVRVNAVALVDAFDLLDSNLCLFKFFCFEFLSSSSSNGSVFSWRQLVGRVGRPGLRATDRVRPALPVQWQGRARGVPQVPAALCPQAAAHAHPLETVDALFSPISTTLPFFVLRYFLDFKTLTNKNEYEIYLHSLCLNCGRHSSFFLLLSSTWLENNRVLSLSLSLSLLSISTCLIFRGFTSKHFSKFHIFIFSN